jgi:YHS domain-containing protein
MKVRDPVCGMTIESTAAAGQRVGPEGTTYFCSVACQRRWDATHPTPSP